MPSRRIDTPWQYASTGSRPSASKVVLARNTRGAQSAFGYAPASMPRIPVGAAKAVAGALHPLFHEVQLIAAIAAEILVTPVARERDGNVLASKRCRRDRSGDRRAVRVRLIVNARQRIDQVEVIAFDSIVDEVPRPVTVGNLLRIARLRRRPGRQRRSSRC